MLSLSLALTAMRPRYPLDGQSQGAGYGRAYGTSYGSQGE